jgi:hypothetical protein
MFVHCSVNIRFASFRTFRHWTANSSDSPLHCAERLFTDNCSRRSQLWRKYLAAEFVCLVNWADICGPLPVTGNTDIAIQWKLHYWLLGYCYRVVSNKASHATATILCCCAPHVSYNHSRFIHQRSLLGLQQISSSEEGRNWARNGRWILPISISTIPQGIFHKP